MERQPPRSGENDREFFLGEADVLDELGVNRDDLGDADVRSLVIRREHPEFEDALERGLREIDLGNGSMNPRLHLAMHEIVATQIWDDSPPEVLETAVRLLDEGYERHEILHMLGRPVSDQMWAALHDNTAYDQERHVAALRALPGSWERERATLAPSQRHNAARQQARRKTREARRRNRRPR